MCIYFCKTVNMRVIIKIKLIIIIIIIVIIINNVVVVAVYTLLLTFKRGLVLAG